MMTPGTPVLRIRDRQRAIIVQDFGHEALVEVGKGERRTWTKNTFRPVVRIYAPRGTPSITDRMRAAHRQAREGSAYAELATLYNVTRHMIEQWVKAVEEEASDRRHLERLGR